MKQVISLLLVCLLLAALFAGCNKTAENPTDSSTAENPADQTQPSTEPAPETTEAAPETAETIPASTEAPEDETFDPDAFLDQMIAAHPGAGAQELCEAMLETPYFTLFQTESTEFYYPGLNYEYVPEGVKESACIVDFMSGSGSLIYAFVPEEGTDPEALAKALEENAMPEWMNYEQPLEHVVTKIADGKVFLTMYREGMQPVTGPIAVQPRDYVEMFHGWIAEHPDTNCLDMAEYFGTHQKICSMMYYSVEEGQLPGLVNYETGDQTEITGFAEGATFTPQISPSTFIGYVFRLEDGADADAFIALLREHANLAWNVCVAANTIITESDGNYVLFMMCTE